MTDRVVIPLPGLGTLDLPRDVFELHLVKPVGRAQPESPAEAPSLLTAEAMEERTGIPASWWMTQARERRLPFRKLGRYVRFDPVEVAACEAYRRRAVDDTGCRIQKGAASG